MQAVTLFQIGYCRMIKPLGLVSVVGLVDRRWAETTPAHEESLVVVFVTPFVCVFVCLSGISEWSYGVAIW